MTLTYNSMDRLVQVSAGTVVLVDYVYGADGQRAAKVTPTATTHYLYEPGGALYAETDGAGTVLREYVTLGGVTLAVIDGGGVSYVHSDHLSTGQKMTDASGAVVWDASYRPFGEVTVTTAVASLNQRFPGQYADAETGYSDNGFRTYDPSLGRYLQSDPIGLAGGLNLYAYAGGNPVMRFDRLGLDWKDDGLKAIGFVVGAGAVILLAPELAVVAAAGWTVGQVAGALGIMGVQFAVGGWCNVDNDLLWLIGEEAVWTVAGGGLGLLVKEANNLWKARRALKNIDADILRPNGRNLPFSDDDRIREINKTLDRIEDIGPFPYKKDGTEFKNLEGRLPDGNYREYTVDTPGAPNRGARRIVQDQDTGRTYYTDDHYGNFTEIDPRIY